MSGLPELPKEISPDGREIWDWAAKLSDHVCRLDRIRRLNGDILRVQRECGSCDHWMKKSCPKERHDPVKGRPVGPSMSAPICNQFEMNDSTKELIGKWNTELRGLVAP